MRFQRSLFTLALALPIAACPPVSAPPAGFTPADEAAIRGLLNEYATTVVAHNWEGNASFYTTDAVRMPPDAPMLQGHAAMIAWATALPPVTGFTVTAQAVGGAGNLAWARGAYTLDVEPPDAAPIHTVGKWQAVYQRQPDDTWLIVSDIWNTDAPTGS